MWKKTIEEMAILLILPIGPTTASSLPDRFNIASDTVDSSTAKTALADSTRSHVPAFYAVSQNYPNPFNAVTTIEYSLPQQSGVFITVYNLIGECIAVLKNDIEDAGYHRVTWEGTNGWGSTVASGIYFYRIIADDFYSYRKMIVLK